MVINEWTEPRCTVASIVGNNITLATLCGMHLWSANYERVLPPPVRIEAAPPAAPLARGEFWHDVEKGLLYIHSTAQCFSQLEAVCSGARGSRVNCWVCGGSHQQKLRSTGCSAAKLSAFCTGLEEQAEEGELNNSWIALEDTLLNISGTTGHTWESISFRYSTWMQPNTPDGYVDNQATTFHCSGVPCGNCTGSPGSATCLLNSFGAAPGAIHVVDSKDLVFRGCEFAHIGSGFALYVDGASVAVTITRCTFTDLSGGFLTLKSGSGFSVTENVASHQAIEYSGSPAYFGVYIAHSDISHNTVSDAGYTAFSQGCESGVSIICIDTSHPPCKLHTAYI